MSEQVPLTQPELKSGPEQHLLPVGEPNEVDEVHHEAARQENIKTSRQAAEEAALPGEATPFESGEQPQADSIAPDKALKDMAFNRLLIRVRKQLNPPARAFSKLVHQPVIDTVSRVAERTIARPSGLLGGSVVAFLGSSTLLYMAKHYGYQYNFLAFALMFAVGFIAGVLIELLLSARHLRR